MTRTPNRGLRAENPSRPWADASIGAIVDPIVDPIPSEADWQRQEQAMAEPAAAPLREVLASPPARVLPPEFALQVAELARRRAQAPSPRVERTLALVTAVLLALSAALAALLQPPLGSAWQQAWPALRQQGDAAALALLALLLAAVLAPRPGSRRTAEPAR